MYWYGHLITTFSIGMAKGPFGHTRFFFGLAKYGVTFEIVVSNFDLVVSNQSLTVCQSGSQSLLQCHFLYFVELLLVWP